MKNTGREFATMSEDERRRYLIEQGQALDEPEEIELGDPRDEERTGRQYGSLSSEVADPNARDGTAATLDDDAHAKAVRKEAVRKEAVRKRDRRAKDKGDAEPER